MKKKLTIFAVLSIAFFSYSQNTSKWYIGLEMGGGSAFGDINEKWNVRQNLNSYGGYDYGYSYNSESLTSASSIFYMGIKPEYQFSNKLSIATGIRFNQVETGFEGNGRYGNYFFLRTSEANSNQTEYYRVKSINEENFYLGIPIELKYTPFHWGRFGFYGKIGTEIGFLLTNKTNIDFQLDEMQQYEKEVLDKIGMNTNNVFSTFTCALGVNFRTKKDWIFNFDIYSGGGILTENNSNLVNLKSMTGVQCSIMMPINLNKK